MSLNTNGLMVAMPVVYITNRMAIFGRWKVKVESSELRKLVNQATYRYRTSSAQVLSQRIVMSLVPIAEQITLSSGVKVQMGNPHYATLAASFTSFMALIDPQRRGKRSIVETELARKDLVLAQLTHGVPPKMATMRLNRQSRLSLPSLTFVIIKHSHRVLLRQKNATFHHLLRCLTLCLHLSININGNRTRFKGDVKSSLWEK